MQVVSGIAADALLLLSMVIDVLVKKWEEINFKRNCKQLK